MDTTISTRGGEVRRSLAPASVGEVRGTSIPGLSTKRPPGCGSSLEWRKPDGPRIESRVSRFPDPRPSRDSVNYPGMQSRGRYVAGTRAAEALAEFGESPSGGKARASEKRKARTPRLPTPDPRLPAFAVRPATRREFLVGAGSLLLLGAAGCGESEGGEESTSEGRIVRHEYGETEVPESPARIMVLDPALLDITLALGVVPAGASPIFPSEDAPGPFPPYLEGVEGIGDEIEEVGPAGAPNLESLASFSPDLIVGSSFYFDENVYGQLSEIAPTVALATYSNPMWKEEIVPLVGEIYGVPEAAEEAVAEYEGRIESLRSELGNRGDIVVSSVNVFAESISLSGTVSPSSLVLGDIGFARPEPQDFELTEDDLSSLPISEERIPDMDGDELFVYVTDAAAFENLRDNELWQTLGAVESGNVHPVTSTAWFFPGLYAADSVLDDIEDALL
ncbi:MAG: iron-siderophore ABC transporter substrate-binding protein [Actinomycetota bacterium]|nr:iron-siderophore ABC transporter substrate-binding protein [Actinomycetota bacterium]